MARFKRSERDMTTQIQSNGKVLPDLAALTAQIEELKAQLAAKATGNKLSFKVSEKGAVSVYGLQRFPVTLYAQSWERLAKAMPDITAFITANAATVSRK
jgi:hypothetical protein